VLFDQEKINDKGAYLSFDRLCNFILQLFNSQFLDIFQH